MLIDPPSRWLGGIDRTFQYIRSCGYSGVELNLSPELLNHLDEIEAAADRNALRIPSLLTGTAYQEGFCLSVPDQGIRDRTVIRLSEYLETAQRFQAIMVVGLLQGLRSDEADPEVAQQRIISCLRQVTKAAERKGVDLVIEPVNHLQVGFNHSVEEVCDLVEAVGSPVLYPMVDTIHMNIEEQSIVQPILDCGPRLRHVHLCENHGGIPGTGNIEFTQVFDALEQIAYSDFASVKVYRKAELRKAIVESMEYFSGLQPRTPL